MHKNTHSKTQSQDKYWMVRHHYKTHTGQWDTFTRHYIQENETPLQATYRTVRHYYKTQHRHLVLHASQKPDTSRRTQNRHQGPCRVVRHLHNTQHRHRVLQPLHNTVATWKNHSGVFYFKDCLGLHPCLRHNDFKIPAHVTCFHGILFAVLNTLLLKGQFPRYTHWVKRIDKGVCGLFFLGGGGGVRGGEERFDTEANSHGPGNGITGDCYFRN